MKSKKAFTLIELLVVIAIIGVLATISVIALQNARAKSRDAKRAGDMKQIQTALELFFNDNNRYPTTEEFALGSIFSTSTYGTSTYMQIIPLAPTPADGSCTSGQNTVYYQQTENGNSYTISFCLGNTTGALTAGPKCLTPAGIMDVDCSGGESLPLAPITTFFVNNLDNGGLGGKIYAHAIIQADDGGFVGAGTTAINDFDGILLKVDSAGSLDTSFATGGRYISNAVRAQEFYSADKTSSGGYIVAGGAKNISGAWESLFVKFNSNGSLDNSFGTSGIATIPFGASSYVNSVKATTDGGYVATGFEGGAGNAFVIKLDANGNLDSSFDSDGIVQLLDLGDGSSIIQNSNNKYLITGSGISGGITVAQLNTDGSLDNSFGTNGLFNFDDPNYGENQPTIIAAGSSYIVAGSMVDIISGDADPFLIKITAAGTIDASFGVNGVSHPTLANNQSISSVARGNDGSLVGVGMSEGSDYKFFAFKTNANGALDANFGTNGILEIGDPGWNDLRDIKKTADGGFITFGESSATGSWTLTMIKIDSQGNY